MQGSLETLSPSLMTATVGAMSLVPPHLVLVGVPEHDRDSWLILKFSRVEGAGIICDYTAAGDLVTVGH